MNNYYIWPNELTPLNYFFMFMIIGLIIAFFVFVFILNKKSISNQRKFLILTFCKRFGLNDYQIDLINDISDRLKTINISSFFYSESYYDEHVIHYIKIKNQINNNLLNDFKLIKQKIKFNEIVPLTTRDISVNQNVKLRLGHIGFITGKIINNDSDGILVSTYLKNAIKKQKVKNNISLYYWDDIYQYEVHSVIKKLSMLNFIQYLLIKHSKIILKNKKTQGYEINIEMSVYFTHIFKLPKDIDIKQHFFKGNINTFSMIGVEIFTNFKVIPIGIFLFEFHSLTDDNKKYHFTGKVDEVKKLKNGKLMFVKYLDMNEECKNYIHDIISERMNEIQ